MIRTRKRCPEIGVGRCRIVPTRKRHVLVVAYSDARAGTVVCIHNLDERQHELTVDLGPESAQRLESILDDGETLASRSARHRVQLDALAYRWYRATSS